MKLPPFQLEHYMEKYEFSAPYLMGSSDAETFRQDELLALADPQTTQLWKELRLGYTEVQGMPLLREEISHLYEHATADDIFCFSGAEEGIFCSLSLLVGKGDHAIVIRPIYQSLEQIPETLGTEISVVCLEENAEWKLDPEKIQAAVRPNTKLIVLNFPNNPTGATLTPGVLSSVVAIAREGGIPLFCDEVYRAPVADGLSQAPAAADSYEKAVSLNVMSKSFGLAGLRVGWIYCRDREFLSQLRTQKHYLSICNSAPSEILALIALRAKERLWLRNQKIIDSNLELLTSFFEKHSEKFQWVKPHAGCVAFPRWLGQSSVDDFAEKLVREEGVMILPGSVFGWKENNFRIGFGRKNFPEALARLERLVREIRCHPK
jgi:aspartate/methionine/tyrosine aminotransferase